MKLILYLFICNILGSHECSDTSDKLCSAEKKKEDTVVEIITTTTVIATNIATNFPDVKSIYTKKEDQINEPKNGLVVEKIVSNKNIEKDANDEINKISSNVIIDDKNVCLLDEVSQGSVETSKCSSFSNSKKIPSKIILHQNDPEKRTKKEIVYEIKNNFLNEADNLSKCYIISTNGDTDPVTKLLQDNNISIDHVYKQYINGVSFCTDNDGFIDELRKSSQIVAIEEDTLFNTSAVEYPISKHLFLMKNYTNIFFNNYFYDNLIFRILQIDRIFRYLFGYYKFSYTGKNTKVYIVDTTVDISNPKISNVSGQKSSCNNHGNIMVDLIANKFRGFARDTEISVLDGVGCDGKIKLSELIYILEAVRRDDKGTVLLFGVMGPFSNILNTIVDKISNRGIIVVSPAGNDRDNSCYYSPGSSRFSLTIGSVNKHSRLSFFSNYGNCVRLYSLGENIYELKNVKGTSFSAATISGLVAMFLEKNPNANLREVLTFFNDNSYWNDNGFLILNSFNLSKNYQKVTVYEEGWNWFDIILLGLTFFILLLFLIIFIRKRNRRIRREEDRELFIPPNQRSQREYET